MSGEISRVNTLYPDAKRRELLWKAIELAWEEVLSKTVDEFRKNSFIEFVNKIFGTDKTEKLIRGEKITTIKLSVEEIRRKILNSHSYKEITNQLKSIEKQLPMWSIEDKIKIGVTLLKKGISSNDNRIGKLGEEILEKINHPKVHYNLGVYYIKRQEYSRAYDRLLKAVKNGYGTNALYNLAVALVGLGKFKEAERYLSEYIRENRNDEKAIQALKKLKTITKTI